MILPDIVQFVLVLVMGLFMNVSPTRSSPTPVDSSLTPSNGHHFNKLEKRRWTFQSINAPFGGEKDATLIPPWYILYNMVCDFYLFILRKGPLRKVMNCLLIIVPISPQPPTGSALQQKKDCGDPDHCLEIIYRYHGGMGNHCKDSKRPGRVTKDSCPTNPCSRNQTHTLVLT